MPSRGRDAVDTAPATGRAPVRLAAPLVALCLLAAAGLGIWHTSPARQAGQLADYQDASARIGQALSAFARLHQGVVRSEDEPQLRSRFEAFAQKVSAVREGPSGRAIAEVPALQAAVPHLENARRQTRTRLNLLLDRGAFPEAFRQFADEAFTLARLAEDVEIEAAALAARERERTERSRLELAGLLGVAVLVALAALTAMTRSGRALWRAQRLVDGHAALVKESAAAVARTEAAHDRVVAAVAHEIRTPMNTVLGFADALLSDPLPREQRDKVIAIRDSGAALLQTADSIIDYARLGLGQIALAETPFSPVTVTAAAVAAILPRAREKGLTIEAIPSSGLPEALIGDPDRIGQVLLNLAANAVRVSRAGGVSVQVRCASLDGRNAEMEWIVTDRGPDLDRAAIVRIVAPAVDARDVKSSRYGGPSLRLAVARELVTRMGGAIEIDPVPGEGNRVRAKIPLPVAPASVRLDVPTAPGDDPLRVRIKALGREPRVLIAEDNPSGQLLVRSMLARDGIAADIAADGAAAVAAAEAMRYDAICMDMRMPVMDGLEATLRSRHGSGPSAATPVIALTASNFPEDIAACREAGMCQFVAKPVARDALVTAILDAIEGVPSPEAAVGAYTAAR